MNLIFGWSWILMGFISGMLMGMKFHHDNWMGGYASHERRLLRLGHISFVGLGFLNILFALSIGENGMVEKSVQVAGYLFIMGAVTMPLSCFLLAFNRKMHLVFSIPVVALIVGVVLTLMGLLK